MSGISSGVGLLSGLPTQDIINQLIQLDARPLSTLRSRVQNIQAQRAALADVGARLLALKGTIGRFDEQSFFRKSKAGSTNESVLSAIANEGAVQGTFQLQVRSLVTNHQVISRGFANSDRQPVGTGELSFEIGHGQLNRPTSLASLNSGDGVRRGSFEITDSAGTTAVIDVTNAISIQDVLDEINSRTDIRVTARAVGDHLVLEDENGGPGLNVRDIGGGSAAGDLGIAEQADANGVLVGGQILRIHQGTRINQLNDGNGFEAGRTNADLDIVVGDRTFTVGLSGLLTRDTHIDVLNNGNGIRTGTFSITNRAGETADVTIDETVVTIGDVIDQIESADIDLGVTIGAAFGQLILTDNSTPTEGTEDPPLFTIADVEGAAAADLGIVFETEEGDHSGNIIHRVETIGDVIRAIDFAVDADGNRNDVIRADFGASGRGIQLTSIGNVAFSVDVAESAISSNAAEALGLIGESDGSTALNGNDLIAGINSVLTSSLRGGQGVGLGVVTVGLGGVGGNDGASVDLAGANSVREIIERFNRVTDLTDVRAQFNDAGNGIEFVDVSDSDARIILRDNNGGTTINDLFGSEAVESGIIQSEDGKSIQTGNLQLQYVSRSTQLSTLGNGRGVAAGSFRITTSDGQASTINLTDSQTTVGDVLDRINTLGFEGIVAQVNANGDGIELIDQTEGVIEFKVESLDGSTTARDLNLLGESVSFVDEAGVSNKRIDGSFEYKLSIDADDALADVRAKINELGIDVRATIINDGSDNAPHHLILTSEVSGTQGELVFDAGSTGLTFDTLVQAQDAIVFFGGSGAENPVVLTSSTNSLNNVLENVTINLNGTSDDPVELSITEDTDAIVADLNNFVSSYNDVVDRIDDLTEFDSETNSRAILFGDSTVNIIQSRLRGLVTRPVEDAVPGFNRLTFVGVSIEAGSRLSFDEQRFREVLAENPEAIEKLFTDSENGLGKAFEEALDNLTRSFDGTLARRDDLLESREDLLEDRMSALQDQLDRKRLRLERQFQGLESSLAGLQGAQSSLGSIAAFAG